MIAMEAEIHAASHIGRVRRGNEDNYLFLNRVDGTFRTKSINSNEIVVQSVEVEVEERGIVLAVSDGCGGLLGGDISSSLAVVTIQNRLNDVIPIYDNRLSFELVERLYDATLEANRVIHYEALKNPPYQGMGATITAVGVKHDVVDFVQVGDSRGYLVRNGKIYQITKDQSLVTQLIDAGEIAADEAETNPLKNLILQALGAQATVFPVATRLIPQKGDILLLFSDGLSNKLPAGELLRIVSLNIKNLKNACEVLIEKANTLGGEDNITVILAKLKGSALRELTDDAAVFYPLKLDREVPNS